MIKNFEDPGEVSPQNNSIAPRRVGGITAAVDGGDFVLFFHQRRFSLSSEGVVTPTGVEEISTLSLSPIVAKAFLAQLAAIISEFEKQSGYVIPSQESSLRSFPPQNSP